MTKNIPLTLLLKHIWDLRDNDISYKINQEGKGMKRLSFPLQLIIYMYPTKYLVSDWPMMNAEYNTKVVMETPEKSQIGTAKKKG